MPLENTSIPISPVAGRGFWLDPHLSRTQHDRLTRMIVAHEGTVHSELTAETTHVIWSDGRSELTVPCEPVRLARERGLALTEITYLNALAILCPTREMALALLRGEVATRTRWTNIQPGQGDPCRGNLRDAELSNLDLTGFIFTTTDLAGTKWVGTNLTDASFADVEALDFRQIAPSSGLVLSRAETCQFDGVEAPGMRITTSMTGCTLRGARLAGATFNNSVCVDCDFSDADLSEAKLSHWRVRGLVAARTNFTRATLVQSNLERANLVGANFHAARLESANLVDARLAQSNLRAANLRGARLCGADLTGADLTGANLTEADLTGANLADAIFTGTRLRGTRVAESAVGGAIGLAEALGTRPEVGPYLQALADGLTGTTWVMFSFTLESPTRGLRQCQLRCSLASGGGRLTILDSGAPIHTNMTTWPGALLDLAAEWPDAVLRCDTVNVRGVRRPGEPRRLLLQALCEVFKQPVPESTRIAATRKASRAIRTHERDELLASLRQPDGVAVWNARPLVERQEFGRFDQADLTGANLAKINLVRLTAVAANFSGADLRKANLGQLNLRRAILDGANLSEAVLKGTVALNVHAVGADLRKADLSGANWTNADLREADLREANLSRACLFGADLTGAKLKTARFQLTRYNAETRFPVGYLPKKGWIFHGAGIPGGAAPDREELDFEQFVERLPELVPAERVKSALTLLNRARLYLFSEVEPKQVVGVVAGQTSGRYACRLTDEGAFVCGTVRLKPCSRQKGSVCPHLIVLLLGLVRAGQLEAGLAFQWLTLARGRTSVPDRESLAATFLRYKEARAGKIDWRPTETLPEDYYAR